MRYLDNPNDEQVHHAVSRRRSSPEWAREKAWLTQSLNKLMDRILKVDRQEDLYRLQGAASLLKEYINYENRSERVLAGTERISNAWEGI